MYAFIISAMRLLISATWFKLKSWFCVSVTVQFEGNGERTEISEVRVRPDVGTET